MYKNPSFGTPFDFIMEKTSDNQTERTPLLLITAAIEQGGRTMASLLRKGPLLGITGSAQIRNVQGEEVQTLDQIGQETFLGLFRRSRAVLSVLSEEAEMPEVLPCDEKTSLLVAMDPLDGSSNISVNAPIGSIFSIFRPPAPSSSSPEGLFLNASSPLLSAYLLYSVSTSLVLAFSGETRVFTLDPDTGEFLGDGSPWRFPDKGKIYSTNEAYLPRWEKPLQDYLSWIKKERNPSMILRYIGALVGDFHRNLLKGGIYLYPAEAGEKTSGKLRLLYEACPMAHIARNAGGIATDGKQDILTIVPRSVHQRVPLIVGSVDLVREFQERTGHPLSGL
ncbi:class 1 fructose-bisphosphatase [Leptospirillum ferriphilum]|uniref:Fructose-1,6-bisphosphatase class 1 n=2 Tax=Leptospirillum ferriphilum TaxID=178606 RepID=J9ZE67_LEPFM|nr:class 1 fructose-bisphosphatase [Leptospirillum ferriphilum]AFS54436.1 fructose-1,6-bisphosphatase [Leptospirillum ferriphilum ML-04]EAY58285.1 MAG: Fructose-1,6-bisphosphatase [Leptospirillum rubarum]